jgi:uncharacterized membrane protein YjdF
LEKIGRVMMDFGIGSFIESIEKHFGKMAAKLMLIVFVFAAVAVCGSAIWHLLLKPMVDLVAGFMPGNESQQAKNLTKFVVFIAFVMIGINWSLEMINRFLETKIRARLRKKVEEVNAIAAKAEGQLARAREAYEDARIIQKQTGDIFAAADLALENVIEAAVVRELITREQANELRNLKDDPSTEHPAA